MDAGLSAMRFDTVCAHAGTKIKITVADPFQAAGTSVKMELRFAHGADKRRAAFFAAKQFFRYMSKENRRMIWKAANVAKKSKRVSLFRALVTEPLREALFHSASPAFISRSHLINFILKEQKNTTECLNFVFIFCLDAGDSLLAGELLFCLLLQ